MTEIPGLCFSCNCVFEAIEASPKNGYGVAGGYELWLKFLLLYLLLAVFLHSYCLFNHITNTYPSIMGILC